MIEQWRVQGEQALNDGTSGSEMLPFTWWSDVGWKQTFEYPVKDFFAEVGFYLDAMGFAIASLSEDYALFTTPKEEFAFSFKKSDSQADLSGFRLDIFTNELDTVLAEVKSRGLEHRVFEGSPGQRVIGLTTPSGLPVEIWSGFEG